jgi:hypothetical protein
MYLDYRIGRERDLDLMDDTDGEIQDMIGFWVGQQRV